jgi:branched-chain amino acid transport system substrate-binding protein
MNRGRRLAALVCGVVALAACGGGGSSSSSSSPAAFKGTVKVALVDVFSGGFGFFGGYLQNSLQVEADQLNAKGGLLGYQIQITTADDQLAPDQGASLVRQQLADSDVKLLVGPSFTSVFLAAKPIINQSKTPNCLPAVAADSAMDGAVNSFRTQEQDRYRIPALLNYVAKNTQIKKIGLIYEGDATGQSYDQQLGSEAGKAGLQYVGAAFTTATATDHKPLVQQILSKGAQGVILSNNSTTAGRTALAIQQLGVKDKLAQFGFSGLGGYTYPQLGGDTVDGTIFAATIQSYLTDIPDTRWPANYRDFVKKITTNYGYATNGLEMKGTPLAADCMIEWSKAVQKAGTFDGTKVVKAWQGLDIPATQNVLGVREKFSASDHNAVPQEGIFVYQWVKQPDGKFRLKQLVGPST